MLNDDIDQLAQRVIGCAITVHREMGPGLNEAVYHECFILELVEQEVDFAADVPIAVSYKGQRLRKHFEIDLVVAGKLIVELKAVDALHPAHQAQVMTYLRLTKLPAGLLINFNQPTLRAGLKRLDHPDIYARKHAKP